MQQGKRVLFEDRSAGRGQSISNRIGRNRYVILGGLLFPLTALFSFYGGWGADFWEHAAVVKELAAHPLHPANPIFLSNSAHPFFSPYLLLVALLCRFTGITAQTMLAVVATPVLVLLLFSLRRFVRMFSGHADDRVEFYSLLLILFLWPTGAWDWSGFIHFSILSFVLPYPATVALSLTFLLLPFFDHFLNSGSIAEFSICLLLAAVVLLTHPTTAIAMFIGIGSLSLYRRSVAGFKGLLAGAGIVLGAIFLAMAWPYYPFLQLIRTNNPEFHTQSRILYSQSYLLWPSVLLLATSYSVVVSRLKRNIMDVLSLMLCGSLVVYSFGYISSQFGLGRIISFAAILVQIAIAFRLAELESSPQTRSLRYVLPAILVFVAVISVNRGNLRILGRAFWGLEGRRYDYSDFNPLQQFVAPYQVVMSDDLTSVIIPAFSGKVVAFAHPAYWIDDYGARKLDQTRFCLSDVTRKEQADIIRRYQIQFVLLNKVGGNPSVSCEGLGETLYSTTNMQLIKVASSVRGAE